LSQIVFRLFEDRIDTNKFTVEVSFSSGTTNDPLHDKTNALIPSIVLQKHVLLDDLLGLLNNAIDLYHSDWIYTSNAMTEPGPAVTSVVAETDENPLTEFTAEHAMDVDTNNTNNSNNNSNNINNNYQSTGTLDPNFEDSFATSLFSESSRFIRSPSASFRHVEPNKFLRNESYTVNMDMKNTSDRWEREKEMATPMVYHPGSHMHKYSRHHKVGHYTGQPMVSKDDMDTLKPILLPPVVENVMLMPASAGISGTASSMHSNHGSNGSFTTMTATARSLSSPVLVRSRSQSDVGLSSPSPERPSAGL
jgi:hypothetical protein